MEVMSLTSSRLLSPSRRVEALVFVWVCNGRESRSSGASTGGEFGGHVLVMSSNVTPLSCEVSIGVVSAPAIFFGSRLWVWVKSGLVVEIS